MIRQFVRAVVAEVAARAAIRLNGSPPLGFDRTACAGCGVEGVPVPAPDGVGGETSHGLCDACLAARYPE